MISFVLDENNLLTRDTLFVTFQNYFQFVQERLFKEGCWIKCILGVFWKEEHFELFLHSVRGRLGRRGHQRMRISLLIFLQKLGSCLSDQDKICQVHNSCNYFQPIWSFSNFSNYKMAIFTNTTNYENTHNLKSLEHSFPWFFLYPCFQG